jgi:hypothetical protein
MKIGLIEEKSFHIIIFAIASWQILMQIVIETYFQNWSVQSIKLSAYFINSYTRFIIIMYE